MTSARQRYTVEEYLELEESSEEKHEFLDGIIRAMGGGSSEHAALMASVSALLTMQLRGKRCRVYSSELRVRAGTRKLITYADVTVVCGTAEHDADARNGQMLINPRVLIEVLSPSTAAYDRGEKTIHYQSIPSVQEIVLVAQHRPEIEVVRREADGTWSRHVTTEGAAQLTSIACELALAEIYLDPLEDR